MKFKTFLNLVIAGVVLLAAGTCYGCFSFLGKKPAAPQPGPRQPRVSQRPVEGGSSAAATPKNPSGSKLSPLDQKILGKAGQKISGDKLKDAFPGPVKVNLYQDDPAAGIVRAKLDLDRDDKWDEKWTFSDQDGVLQVKREVSPQDDDASYTLEYELVDGAWVAQGGAPLPASTPAAAASTAEVAPGDLRPQDQRVIDQAFRKLSSDKEKDALPGPWKVNLYQDTPGQGVNRAKIDLDKDEKWDEKWTFESLDGQVKVKRQVAPGDDEVYTEEYRLENGRWVKK